MKKIILLYINTILYCASSFGQSQFPDYKEVVNLFFEEYDLKEDQNQQDIQFHKKPQGYFIYEKTTDKTQLFWSASENKYLRLNFHLSQGRKSYSSHHYFLRKSMIQYYARHRYYGYIGWEKDNIDWFTKKETLTPTDQESLARSYSEIAINLLNNNMGYAEEDEVFVRSDSGFNLLDKKQLKEYRFYQDKSIESFNELCLNHPEYQTYVGTACNKYGNEKMSSFLNLMIYQNKEEAMKEITDSTYSNFLIEAGKNYLVNCDSNAILFTNGDNDTYPLLYVQAQGYRTDVSIINLSLLNTLNYLYLVREGEYFGAKPVHFSMTHNDYIKEFKDLYTLIQSRDSHQYKTMPQLFNLITTQDSVTYYNTTETRVFPSDKIIFFKNTPHPITLDLTGEKYLYLSDIASLDIIASNPERPIHFTSGIHKTKGILFDNYLYKSGKIKKLTFKTETNKSLRINEQEYSDYLYNDILFNYKKFSTHEQKGASFFSLGFQYDFTCLSEYYLERSDKDNAKKLVELYKEKFLFDAIDLHPLFSSFVHNIYELGLTDESEEFVTKFIKQFNQELKNSEITVTELEDLELYTRYLMISTAYESDSYNALNSISRKAKERLTEVKKKQ